MAITKTTVTDPQPVFIVAMGVSGTGKSTLGAALAKALHMPYIDGDDLHPKTNVEKMARGEPLTDEDRAPWLRTIRGTAVRMAGEQADKYRSGVNPTNAVKRVGVPGVVIACSALKRVYRDVLRGEDTDSTSNESARLPTYFVFIDGSREVLMQRMLNRSGHFMKAGMLDSQLNTLESPAGEEGVVVVSVEESTPKQVERAVEGLKAFWV
ncbi:P-loop containing nucleoside triphosphate hydrolase protein [Mycena metata]|uniref:Gluconokinase n=1 Tax=Mycena metata TaxID=1033252 RepID=A0AAD7IQP8_9AGAR|nr:P-loop containing nucleoside triphosphate hydrolase protein [Mycena metata]